MTVVTGVFTLPPVERVISGRGSISALPRELERLGCARPAIVTGRTLGASQLLDRLLVLFPRRAPDVFAGARQHVPFSSVCELAVFLREHDADGVISFGGGSPIDTVKAAVHLLIGESGQRTTPPVHVAVPTTLSAGEFTPVAGVTDDATRIKRAIHDRRLTPRVVILDPELTQRTPGWLWAASGIRALDHAIEASYSNRHHPLGDTLATKAIQLLLAHLPASLEASGDVVDHRGSCQMAAWFAVFGMVNAGFGLSHVFGHQIGPRWNVPHGVTSCIVLPHAMRFMARLAPQRFGPIAEGFGLRFDVSTPFEAALACADRTAQLIAALGMPVRLREVNVPEGELHAIGAVVHQALQDAGTVDRPVALDEILGVLAQAY